MNNIASLIPFGTLRRSLKRDQNDENSNENNTMNNQQQQQSTASCQSPALTLSQSPPLVFGTNVIGNGTTTHAVAANHSSQHLAKRSASAKRLPFSTIKSNSPVSTQDIAELPPSPKLLDEGISAKPSTMPPLNLYSSNYHHRGGGGGGLRTSNTPSSSATSPTGAPLSAIGAGFGDNNSQQPSFVRCSYKTYSFHNTYRRRTFRYRSPNQLKRFFFFKNKNLKHHHRFY